MKKRTIRQLLKWSLPINIILFTLVLLDYFVWDSQAIIGLFVIYGIYIIWLLILLLLRAAAPMTRLQAEPEDRNIIVYPRNHG